MSNADVWDMLRASRDGDLDRIKELVNREPGLVACEFNYTPPIHFAVREGHLEVARFLLGHMMGPQINGGADPSSYRTYPFGDTLLTTARDRNQTVVAEIYYVECGRSLAAPLDEFINCRSSFGFT